MSFKSRCRQGRRRANASHAGRATFVEALELRRLFTSVPAGFSDATVVEGLISPTAMQFAPDGRLFVSEQSGSLRVIKNGTLLAQPFVALNTQSFGERGLLGIAFDPNFASNHYLYLYYTATSPTIHNRVSRFTANGDVVLPGSEVVLMDLDNLSSASNHNGGAMNFGADGKLYIAVGENAIPSNAQSLTTVLGKMLRINADGSIPVDNPFYSQTAGNNRAIWALGLRNPFTFAFQPGSRRMFINDVGQNTWEEINDGRSGANYGWPLTEGATTQSGIDTPFYSYDHTQGIAITGGAFYNPGSATFPGAYDGDYFFADYGGGWIRSIDLSTKAVTELASNIEAPVDLRVGADGAVYYLERGLGRVGRIQFTGSLSPGISDQPDNGTVTAGTQASFNVIATGASPLAYQWQRNNVDVAGATSPTYSFTASLSDNSAQYRVRVTNAYGMIFSNPATLTVTANNAPSASIINPIAGTRFNAGTTISYSGSGSDQEDGALPATAFKWQVDYYTGIVQRPFVAPTSGATSGSFTIPRITPYTAPDVFYRIILTVEDSQGLTRTVTRDILPNTSTLTIRTAPAGLPGTLDGQPFTSQTVVESVVGLTRSIGASAAVTLNGQDYIFDSWSDGGARTHDVNTPAVDTVYTATYRFGFVQQWVERNLFRQRKLHRHKRHTYRPSH